MVSKKLILDAVNHPFKGLNYPKIKQKHQGKVRDTFILDNERIIITTDRQSAFDKVLGHIPYKGAVLNQLSSFWFEKTKDIIPNHLLSVIDPNAMVVQNATLIPIEMVIRGYITGVTDTSIWGSYEKGERVIYGIRFPEGLKKNQKLPEPVITPTTKAESGHDERLTEKEILEKKIVGPKLWKQMKEVAIKVFLRGQKIADKAGIILADTKYEFGLLGGKLILIDEVHTPDSSRYWTKKTYKERFKKGLEPESFDKEVLRMWFKERGYKGEGKIPQMPPEFIEKMSTLYQKIYEQVTGKTFKGESYPIEQRIKKNIENFLKK
jgi:phosphoribosylaminoimidazole-succinocarboxamide synthase